MKVALLGATGADPRQRCRHQRFQSVFSTWFQTLPCGSQKRANAHKTSASRSCIVGPSSTVACCATGAWSLFRYRQSQC